MKRVAVLGGGISGLSTCFYLTRIQPAWHVTLFEPAALGGYINTVSKDGFTFETGPRSLRVSDKASAVLDIAEEVGVIDKVRVAATTNKDVSIYADGQLRRLFPAPPFSQLKFILSHPVHIRTALAWLPTLFRRKKQHQPVSDQSISDFVQSFIRFANLDDANYVTSTYVDALVQGIYSGDVNSLSARSCLPFSPVFMRKNIPGYKREVIKSVGLKSGQIIAKALNTKANAITFEGGLSVLVKAMETDLTSRGVEICPEKVTEISEISGKGKVKSTTTEGEFDYVISTIPSYALCEVLKGEQDVIEAVKGIKHNSLTAVNIGLEKMPFKGVGYLLPTRAQKAISGVLLDSCQFPYMSPCISVMIPGEPVTESILPQIIDEIATHTGHKIEPKTWHMTYAKQALPQHEIGHYKRVEVVQEKQPKWLRVSGQSLYPTGIPNCVLTAHSTVSSVLE